MINLLSLRRFGVILLALLFAAPTAFAQEIAGSFDQLRVLIKSGDTITITDNAGVETKGKLAELSPTSLALTVGDDRRTVNAADISTVQARRGDSVANGAKWGLGVGATIGLLVGLAMESMYDEDSNGALAVSAAITYGGLGAGIGAGLDALHEKEQVIFARPRTTARRLAVQPMMGKRTGVTVAIGF